MPTIRRPRRQGSCRGFARIDVLDIEIDETDPGRLVELVASLEPTFGGSNLADID